MKKNNPDKKTLTTAKALQRERKEILSLPPEKALDRILAAKEPAALVHSFPEQDLYLLIHDIGPEDALPVLSLASDRQWEYLLDMEAWQRDRMDMRTLTRWLDLLYRADARRTIQWLIEQKTDELEHYLHKNIEVKIREHDQDPSEFDKTFLSLDDVFYVRVAGEHLWPASELGDIEKAHYQRFITKLLQSLAAYDHITYQKIILEAVHVLPAEAEEAAFRLRNVRLAEKGFLPFDEAVGVYQPLKPRELAERRQKFMSASPMDLQLPVPVLAAEMLEGAHLFARALHRIKNEALLQQLQTEFATLCNQIIVADQKTVRSKEDLKQVVQKASGYLTVGLETLAVEPGRTKKASEDQSAAQIQRHPLGDLFRIGFGRALNLKWQAAKWLSESWFNANRLPLMFWGETWLGILGGLLIKKPLYFDNYKSGKMYRDFVCMADIAQTEKDLRDIIAVDRLLALLDVKLKPLSHYRFLTYKNLLLTLWVRHWLKLSDTPQPVSFKVFKTFFPHLWQPQRHAGRIVPGMKTEFMSWLSARSGCPPEEIGDKLGPILEGLFNEIEEEYGQVADADLDPRFIQLFLVSD